MRQGDSLQSSGWCKSVLFVQLSYPPTFPIGPPMRTVHSPCDGSNKDVFPCRQFSIDKSRTQEPGSISFDMHHEMMACLQLSRPGH